MNEEIRTPLENLRRMITKRIRTVNGDITKETVKDVYIIQKQLCDFLIRQEKEINLLRLEGK